MAGSYNHCVNEEGKLLSNEDLNGMLENGGDVYEAVEEMYGMIWYLATMIKDDNWGNWESTKRIVEEARTHYKEGIADSPGTEE